MAAATASDVNPERGRVSAAIRPDPAPRDGQIAQHAVGWVPCLTPRSRCRRRPRTWSAASRSELEGNADVRATDLARPRRYRTAPREPRATGGLPGQRYGNTAG